MEKEKNVVMQFLYIQVIGIRNSIDILSKAVSSSSDFQAFLPMWPKIDGNESQLKFKQGQPRFNFFREFIMTWPPDFKRGRRHLISTIPKPKDSSPEKRRKKSCVVGFEPTAADDSTNALQQVLAQGTYKNYLWKGVNINLEAKNEEKALSPWVWIYLTVTSSVWKGS